VLFEAGTAFWWALPGCNAAAFMFHRSEQKFLEAELPCVLSAGKMLLQLIVDLG
jgi:hypothetical protein